MACGCRLTPILAEVVLKELLVVLDGHSDVMRSMQSDVGTVKSGGALSNFSQEKLSGFRGGVCGLGKNGRTDPARAKLQATRLDIWLTLIRWLRTISSS